ncbi:MAG: bacillithiol biosynthesis BshC, partial [Geodermatophilaceae bacterium]|nr:bacillithiol biosynthesis BshC [Geodermatophilaceae bacterium]
ILPTVAYVAGPGELAYFAQVSAVAEALECASPLAVPRWSCRVIEPHVQRMLDRFGVGADALSDPHALERAAAASAMSPRSAAALHELRETIDAVAESLAVEAEPIGIRSAVEGGAKGLLRRVDRLERRLLAGVKRRETVLMRDVATLRAALYPLGVPQERMMNLLPVLARHGTSLLAELRSEASVHAAALVTGSGTTVPLTTGAS